MKIDLKDYLEEPSQLERQVRVEGWFPEGKQWTDSVPEVCAIVSTNLSLSGGGPMVLNHTKYNQKNLKNSQVCTTFNCTEGLKSQIFTKSVAFALAGSLWFANYHYHRHQTYSIIWKPLRKGVLSFVAI